MKVSEYIENAKMKAAVFLRERREKAAERAAAKRAARPSEYGFARNPRRIRFAVMLATWGVIGFLLLWITQITGVLKLDLAIDWALNRPFAVDWDLQLDLNVLPLIVLGIVSFAIVFWSKAWVSHFAETPWRDWFTKWGTLVLGIGGSAAIIMGGFEVNQNTRQEDFRGALVQEQAATQGRAALTAQISSIDQRLAGMRDQAHVGVYAAIAATVGTAAYDANYLSAEALARTPADRRDIVRRARGAAVAADALEAQRLTLVGQQAAATPAAATEAVVTMTDPVSQFIGGIGAWRIVILVLVGDLILLLGNYFADKAEERLRYAGSVQASGWADEGHRIEDLRGEEVIDSAGRVKSVEPMKPPRRKFTEAETGEEVEETLIPAHYRKLKRGKPTKVEIKPEPLPDEVGVEEDGGNRMASVEPPASEGIAPADEAQPAEAHRENQAAEDEGRERVNEAESSQPEPPEETADYDALVDSLTPEPPVDEENTDAERDERTEPDEQAAEAVNESEDVAQDEPQPETRQDRLLPAPESVAAE